MFTIFIYEIIYLERKRRTKLHDEQSNLSTNYINFHHPITLVNVIISIIERRKQIAKINTLWDNKLKLESFIRLIHDSMPNITLTVIITMSSHLSTIRLGQT